MGRPCSGVRARALTGWRLAVALVALAAEALFWLFLALLIYGFRGLFRAGYDAAVRDTYLYASWAAPHALVAIAALIRRGRGWQIIFLILQAADVILVMAFALENPRYGFSWGRLVILSLALVPALAAATIVRAQTFE